MADYLLFFVMTLGFSTLFTVGGIGSAIALVPAFIMMGLPINLAKAIGLFINTASTLMASIMNAKRGVLNVKTTLPLIITLLLATPIGAYLSHLSMANKSDPVLANKSDPPGANFLVI